MIKSSILLPIVLVVVAANNPSFSGTSDLEKTTQSTNKLNKMEYLDSGERAGRLVSRLNRAEYIVNSRIGKMTNQFQMQNTRTSIQDSQRVMKELKQDYATEMENTRFSAQDDQRELRDINLNLKKALGQWTGDEEINAQMANEQTVTKGTNEEKKHIEKKSKKEKEYLKVYRPGQGKTRQEPKQYRPADQEAQHWAEQYRRAVEELLK